MIIDILQKLGLAKNEARIYETLLRENECGVSTISAKAEINRRNVYDSLNRLIEKGLVFEIHTITENRYRAVDPSKLSEIIDEKREQLNEVFPEMERLYRNTSRKEEIFVYRGIEGWKNYLRDIIRIGEDTYVIGAVGAWVDPRLSGVIKSFLKDAHKAGITFHCLANHEMEKTKGVKDFPLLHYKSFPKEYSTKVAVDVFGDHVVTLSGLSAGSFDEHSSLTVIVNREIADAYRLWFKFMWNSLPGQALKSRKS